MVEPEPWERLTAWQTGGVPERTRRDPEPQIWIIDYFLLTLWRYLFPGLPWKIDNSVINRNILLILFNYD